MTPGPLEIGIIFLIVLLLFGAKRIPEIARGLGSGIREFKQATRDVSAQINADSDDRQHQQRSQIQTRPPQGQTAAREAYQPQEQPAPPREEPPAQPTRAEEPTSQK